MRRRFQRVLTMKPSTGSLYIRFWLGRVNVKVHDKHSKHKLKVRDAPPRPRPRPR